MSEQVDRRLTDDFDPLAPETLESPYDVFRTLRQTCPLAHTNAYKGFWMLTRYSDVLAASMDHSTYITSVKNVIPDMSIGVRRPPFGKDPPEHTPYRRALDRTLQKSRVERIGESLRLHAGRELQRMIDAGGGDISQDFATIYPAWVAAEWLNLPAEWVDPLADAAKLYNVAWRSMDVSAVRRTSEQLYGFARQLVADRKAKPRVPELDPTSALLDEKIDGVPIADDMVVQTIRQSLVVGLMAPPPLMGSIAIHLSRDQALQQRLRADPGILPAALEEFLRLYAPYRGFARTVARPVTLHGREVRPGEPIAMVYSSANRDETVFAEPDAFKLNRDNITDHMAFGRGAHRCAGAQLARLEFKIALEELLRRTRSFELCGPIETTRLPELGAISTPLRMRPASIAAHPGTEA